MVNGEPITNFDIEQRTKLNALSGAKTNSRQDVIDELINEKVKIKEGKKYSVDPGASEVDGAFQNMSSRMRLTPDQLVQSLASKGIRPDTLKSRLKADMVWNAIVRGRFKQSLQVGEKEVDRSGPGSWRRRDDRSIRVSDATGRAGRPARSGVRHDGSAA